MLKKQLHSSYDNSENMPVFSIKVKWGKETFKNVEVDTDCDVEDFKAQLYALSNVPIERQKIMCLGKTLNDEWNIPLKNVSIFISLCKVIV